ncbi:MAG: UPF0182 family protein [Acidimicrobiia bacterium]
MRVTSADVPRRSLGLRGWLIGAAVVLVIGLLSLRGLARFYTDYLWFKEVGFDDTWRRLLSAKAVPALIFSTIFFVVMLVNLIVADRVAPRYRSAAGPEDEIIERYRNYIAPYSGRLRVVVALFFALIMGGGVSAEWRSWILFQNSVDFGQKDPQFNRDLGFYVFRLPFLEFAVGWTFAALLVVLIVTAVFHYLNGGIRVQSPWQRVTPQVKVHLSVILALMALTKTVQYYLARYELVFSRRGFVDGASYTDVKAQLPALNLLMIISIAAAALFIANIFRKGWVFPVIAVGLWAFISLVVGTIYPAVIQRFVVQPNEFSREEPYIERNIAMTRAAFGLDDARVDTQGFDYATNLVEADVAVNDATLQNIRLWDPSRLQEVFRAEQERFPFYRFNDVDADRYTIGADDEQATMIALRELDAEGIPDRTWTNRHLAYTHGYGVVASAANLSQDGAPSYLASEIPVQTDLPSAPEQSGVYFGEHMSGYVVVGTNVAEQEPTASGETEETQYTGDAGVEVSSFFRKSALALRFGDWNLFVSGQLTDESRVLYKRDIKERVSTAAPFLRFDSDPYPVVVNNRILWVLDAYTISDRYPYSQSINPSNLPDGSGLDTDFNYVRNSVKATVDAYDGTITFYVVDDAEDPIIESYQKAFPELFTDAEIPAELREHWRYPEDMFRAQTEQFTTYHLTDASDFFRKQFLWDIAPRPERAATAATTATTGRGNDGGRSTTLAASGSPIEPLFLTMQLPGKEGQEFVLLRPFVPRGKPNQLSAFMVAQTDGANYGKLTSYEIPTNQVAPSPAQAATLIESDPLISETFTPLDLRGSEVLRGDVQLVPLGESIVYARPIFVEGQGEGQFPRLRFVALAYGNSALLVDFDGEADDITTVQEGLEYLVSGEEPPPPDEPTTPEEPTPEEPGTTTTTQPPPTGSAAELLSQAAAELEAAEAARQAGDLGEYQARVTEAKRLLDAAVVAQGTSPTTATAAG